MYLQEYHTMDARLPMTTNTQKHPTGNTNYTSNQADFSYAPDMYSSMSTVMPAGAVGAGGHPFLYKNSQARNQSASTLPQSTPFNKQDKKKGTEYFYSKLAKSADIAAKPKFFNEKNTARENRKLVVNNARALEGDFVKHITVPFQLSQEITEDQDLSKKPMLSRKDEVERI